MPVAGISTNPLQQQQWMALPLQLQYDSGVATFADNGTGIIVYNGGFAESFKWSVAEDVITITYDLSTTSIPYTILDDSASDYQHWSGTYTYMLGPMEVVIDSDLTLSAIGD